MARRKLLSEQKGNLTVEQQENFKEAEEKMGQLTPLSADIPAFLQDSEVAAKLYVELVPLLKELPVSQLDRTQLAVYCQFYAVFVQASEIINNDDLIEKSDRGSKVNVAFQAQRQAQDQMSKIAPRLGMTIDSRLKIFTPKEDKEDDPFAKVLGGK